MGTRVKFAKWIRDGKLYRVQPPNWPRQTEYSCTDQETLIQWAHNHGYMLRDGNPPRRDRAYGRYA